jgi:hypothetical protein
MANRESGIGVHRRTLQADSPGAECWHCDPLLTTIQALTAIYAALDASIELGRSPGLRSSVHQRLREILEAALERNGQGPALDKAAPLLLRLDDYEVTYTLDLDNACAHILSVERFEERRPPVERAFSRNLVKAHP